VDYVVTREGMGGAIHGNEYASRSRFLEYTMEFEERLAEAKKKRRGPGILVFYGNGFGGLKKRQTKPRDCDASYCAF
jgi:hypothetical protein